MPSFNAVFSSIDISANSAARAATARRNSRTSPEEEPQCPGASAAGSSVH